MHAGLLIALWMSGVAALQFLPAAWLFGCLIAAGILVIRFAGRRGLRLLRRVRFLVLAILVFFAWFTPGELLWASFPALSPTREGLALAAEHAGRLIAVVLCVAVLLEFLSVARLVGGLYALLRPLEPLGFPAARLAVRMVLVLRYVEEASLANWQSWLHDEQLPPAASTAAAESIVIVREPLGWQLIFAALVVLVVLVLLEFGT